MIDLHRACHLHPSDPVQAAAGGASTLGAVRRATEYAGFDARFKIRGIIGGHLGKQAIVRILRRMKKCLCKAIIEEQLRIPLR